MTPADNYFVFVTVQKEGMWKPGLCVCVRAHVPTKDESARKTKPDGAGGRGGTPPLFLSLVRSLQFSSRLFFPHIPVADATRERK